MININLNKSNNINYKLTKNYKMGGGLFILP